MSTGAYDVLSEHQHIRRLVDALDNTLEKRGQSGRGWIDELAPVLGELADGLDAHFKGEQSELFTDVSTRLPRHQPTVERLIEQHQHLSQDFARVAGQLATLDLAQTDAVDEFVAALSRALKLLRTHEEQENELMLVAYWQDLGEGD
jgi:hemerythrin-like domain-containing protein